MKNQIKALRIERGLKQNELAEKAKISWRQLSNIENDKTDPKISTLVSIATALETTVGYLLCEDQNTA